MGSRFPPLAVCVLAMAVSVPPAIAQDVRIGVFGLFRPRELSLKAEPAQALMVKVGQESFVLDPGSGQTAIITPWGTSLLVRVADRFFSGERLEAGGRNQNPVDFTLAVPEKLHRTYHGTLEITTAADVLVPVVRMELEVAVASAIDAESAPDVPLEALKAQAVATRSYLVAARGRHQEFDFCDTTHCQFLRGKPAPGGRAALAAEATRGLVLEYETQAVAAMYSRSCGGHTRTLREAGLASQGYPYFAVTCDYCLRHPARWTRTVTAAEARDLQDRGEAARLELDRRRGWDFIPSNNFTAGRDGDAVVLKGRGQGHGIGLCQEGARAMAKMGAGYRQILDHYYPNTVLMSLPQTPGGRQALW